jgi:hypothetical protein
MWAVNDLALRWTIGDVSADGFEALRLSVWGAWRVFGPGAVYDVLVNSVPLARARELTGPLPAPVRWHNVTRAVPKSLKPYLDGRMAEGVGWKFAPLRLHPEKFELSLDNDCILWDWPEALQRWLDGDGARCLIAEDVRTMLGQFEGLCGPEPRNSGIRGTPPGFDFEDSILRVLARCPVRIKSELDEQGLVTAALSLELEPLVVKVEEVSICSPFPPHVPWLGQCGAHFVGLNARNLPWALDGRPASEYIREHWRRHRKALYERVRPEG